MAKRKKDNDDEDQNNLNQSDDSADNFGLPDIEYKPLDRTEPVEPEPVIHEETFSKQESNTYNEQPEEETSGYYEDEEESRSNAPAIIGVIIAVIVLAAGFAIWKYVYLPKKEKERIELARIEKKAQVKKEQEARIAREAQEAEQKRLADEAAAKAKPVEGTIETLGARTQRFYVVLASDIDDDLIMDYAKRLSAKGVSTKIVPPFGTTKFFRLAMGDYDSYASAQSGADAAKGDYGNSLWVIRY